MEMADKLDLVAVLIWGIVGGVVGYVFGTLLGNMGIFPELQWANIFLFLGVLIGAFKDKLQ